MRDLKHLQKYRLQTSTFEVDGMVGAFQFPSPIDNGSLRVIASSHDGWDHVSVSRANRCPNWPEMSYIAQQFFADDEVAMQLHVPASEHVNNHPNCLHWWRPTDQTIPLPPSSMVGVKGTTPERVKVLLAKVRQGGMTESVLEELEKELGLGWH